MEKNTSTKLAQELEPLQQRIAELDSQRLTLELELGRIEAELQAVVADQPRFDALKEVCDALDRLEQLAASDLFWNELPQVPDPEVSLDRLRRLPDRYRERLESIRGRREALQAELKRCRDERDHLDGKVHEAYLREQQRQSEFVIEREVTFFPMRAAVMPWSREVESERYFRRALLVALLISFLLGGIVPLVKIPEPDRTAEVAEIPERIARLVRSVPPVPEAPPAPQVAEEKPEKAGDEKPEEKKPEPEERPAAEETARQKAQSSGVLAFQETFRDMIVDAPSARLVDKARVADAPPRRAGNSLSRRSLVALQATGSSGGIDASAISRNIGDGTGGAGSGTRLGGVSFSRVESTVANLAEQEGREATRGPTPGRTDEEIQIVFDRYKSTLYRIYNKELRRDPTLRGNILLRITIEPGGEVSACSVESTDLASPELVKLIVERVLRFNFGPKPDVQKTTILYPIDFLPAN